jgi:hypothetical protein
MPMGWTSGWVAYFSMEFMLSEKLAITSAGLAMWRVINLERTATWAGVRGLNGMKAE